MVQSLHAKTNLAREMAETRRGPNERARILALAQSNGGIPTNCNLCTFPSSAQMVCLSLGLQILVSPVLQEFYGFVSFFSVPILAALLLITSSRDLRQQGRRGLHRATESTVKKVSERPHSSSSSAKDVTFSNYCSGRCATLCE
jgi:hypothetical protein